VLRYFLFSSDHGFQLGQFNIPMDKRHVYAVHLFMAVAIYKQATL
jgi:hypothetical protein